MNRARPPVFARLLACLVLVLCHLFGADEPACHVLDLIHRVIEIVSALRRR